MTEPRQRNIPLGIEERRRLDRHKQDYENGTGDTGDWGKFLGVVTLAGLAALGIYALARVTRREPTVWQVNCPTCLTAFPIQVPNPPPWRVNQVTCPTCHTELVIDFARLASSLQNGHQSNSADVGDTAYTAYCHFCHQPIEFVRSAHRVNPRGVEYLRCPTCRNVATYALLGVE
jgi:hypothetical protein